MKAESRQTDLLQISMPSLRIDECARRIVATSYHGLPLRHARILQGYGQETAIATASALEEPATAVRCGALGATDLTGQFFGEALVDGVDESSLTQHDSAVSIPWSQLESRR